MMPARSELNDPDQRLETQNKGTIGVCLEEVGHVTFRIATTVDKTMWTGSQAPWTARPPQKKKLEVMLLSRSRDL